MKKYNVYSSGENYGDYNAKSPEDAVEQARAEWDLDGIDEIFAIPVEE